MKVLHCIYGLNIGGAETFIYNVLSNIDNKKYIIDLVIQGTADNGKLIELCESQGNKIYKITSYKENFMKSLKELDRLIKKERYDIIHYHVNSLINIVPIIAAKRNKVQIIVHSHNSQNNKGGKIGKVLHLFHRVLLGKMFDERIACSTLAGDWMFGSREYYIFNNAVDINAYKYNKQSRETIRQQLGIPQETIVFGHVGRFVRAKNHEMLIRCFSEYVKKNENAYLIMVGEGELRKEIQKKCEQLNIENKTLFTGNISYINQMYSVFDGVVFPSFFEGLPFVLIEAQAAGLPILASTCVTEEVNVSGLVTFLPLDKEEKWLAEMEKIVSWDTNRSESVKKVQGSKFDIKRNVEDLEKIYGKYAK